jgi:thiol-disulfide isomerase/thioredoxin
MKLKNMLIGVGVLVLLVIGVFAIFGGNNTSPTGNIISSDDLTGDQNKVTIYFFWGDGCPHCETQKPYLEEWQEKYGDKIEVKSFETWKNKGNLVLFQEAAAAYGIQARGVPTTFIGEKHWVGFSSLMALEMESYIQECIENGYESPLK